MWSIDEKTSSVSPSEFKKTVGAFAPRFKGFSQHDSQEFLGTNFFFFSIILDYS